MSQDPRSIRGHALIRMVVVNLGAFETEKRGIMRETSPPDIIIAINP